MENKEYVIRVKIQPSLLRQINNWLNARRREEFQGKNINVSVTAEFPDGCAMEILCRGCNDAPSWTEAVLRDTQGEELLFSGQDVEFSGSWTIVNGDNTYTAIVTEG